MYPHFYYKIAHFGIFVRCTVGLTRLVHGVYRFTGFILFSEIESMVSIGICCGWRVSLWFGWFLTHPSPNPKCYSHQDRVLLCEFLEFNDSENILSLKHWGRHKMADILQMTLPNAFPWMLVSELRWTFHWSLIICVQLTIFQHWLR